MTDLDERLDALANQIQPPETPLHEDLARGRARVRRQRVAVGASALAVAAVAALGVGVSVAGQGESVYAGGDGTPLPGPETSLAPPGPSERVLTPSPDPQPQTPPGLNPAGLSEEKARALLADWNTVLAQHLDPDRAHLEAVTDQNWNLQSGGDSLGSRYAWTDQGETGMGMLVLSVSNGGWGSLDSACSVDISCTSTTVEGATRAVTGTKDGVTAVALERPDGTVLGLAFDPLFGNNSTVPVSGPGPSADHLLDALSDPRIDLPGDPAHQAPPIALVDWRSAGVDVLVGPHDTFTPAPAGSESRQPPSAGGQWTGSSGSGELWWDVEPVAGDGAYDCFDVQFTQCRVVTTAAGDEVFVGQVRNRWGGGWQAIHNGAVYSTRLIFTPSDAGDDFPVERAFAFLTDSRWQPAG